MRWLRSMQSPTPITGLRSGFELRIRRTNSPISVPNLWTQSTSTSALRSWRNVTKCWTGYSST
jgi:hypothetical protein